ncbi:DNA glycosylase [Sordaria brevicollis]|uniref:DNA glycosylase n=1 Tax=Sordaria brevicollis TaxID=83679 RepID=A0AAE0NW44_SORBR|nr:DNA glycosylase [Sordaria brevicollis]
MGVQTRSGAKRVKVVADDNIVVVNPLQNPVITPGPASETIVASIEIETEPRAKRKRVNVTPTQPVKDAPKVLLHGMGDLQTSDTTPETIDQLISLPDAPTYRTRSVTKRQSQPPLVATNAEVEDVKTHKTAEAKPPKNDNHDNHEEHSTRNRRVTRSSSKKLDLESDENLPTGNRETIIKTTAWTTKVATTKSITVDRDSPDYKMPIKRGLDNPMGLAPGFSPYPNREVPTPRACEDVYRILAAMHGNVEQPKEVPKASLEKAGCGEVPCVLDALLRTLISGNTLMAMADKAIQNVVQEYGLREHGSGAGSIDWDKVAKEPVEKLAQAIKVSGNGNQKAKNIKLILESVAAEMARTVSKEQKSGNGSNRNKRKTSPSEETLNLDHMHNLTKDEAMARFVLYPGIGIKSAACVTLFCLQKPCFAVDTHVHRFCRWLGWVPEKASPEDCFKHCDVKVPDHLKYGLHKLFIRHGQECFRCRKATRPGTKEWMVAPECPLEELLDRGKEKL